MNTTIIMLSILTCTAWMMSTSLGRADSNLGLLVSFDDIPFSLSVFQVLVTRLYMPMYQ